MRLDKVYSAVDELLGGLQGGKDGEELKQLVKVARAESDTMRDDYQRRLKLNGRLRGSGRSTEMMVSVLSRFQRYREMAERDKAEIPGGINIVVADVAVAEHLTKTFRRMAEASDIGVGTLDFDSPGIASVAISQEPVIMAIQFVTWPWVEARMEAIDPNACFVDHAAWIEG